MELKRFDEKNLNVSKMEKMLRSLLVFSKQSFKDADAGWYGDFSSIINFQDQDGSFRLINTYEIESEARVRYCYYPSYYCTGILMKAYLANKDYFTGKEDCILPQALKFCCGRGLKGQGYDDLSQQIEIMDYFISCGLREFIEKTDFCPEFTKMIRFIVNDYRQCIEKRKFVFYFGENHEADFKRIVKAMTEQTNA